MNAPHQDQDGFEPTDDPLWTGPERVREMGYAVVDLLADLLGDPRARPAQNTATADELRARLHGPPPEAGRAFEEVLEQVRTEVLPFTNSTAHPSYFAFIPGAGTFPGALGDLLASALNIEGSAWLDSAGTSQLELTVLDWFRQWIGYPSEAEGVLLSGGSAANLTALACAREALVGPMRGDVVAYVSDQGHSSIARAARALGFRPDQLRVLPVDDEFRMRPDALEGAISADREAGRTPLVVCAAAGSTNTGAIDPLPELADVCAASGTWLHVDAAYGGFAALTERGRRWLAGIERADSVTLDPHKWLYQPFECGSLLVRDGELLERAFRIVPDYLKDARGEEVNFGDRNLQLTRMTRALKLWLSIGTFGLGAFRAAIDRALDLAALAERRVSASEDLELMRPARLGIVCFRRRFGDGRTETETEDHNRRLIMALERSGVGLVSSTRLRGRYAIRLCVLNHTTGERDVLRVLDWLEHADIGAEPPAAPALGDHQEPRADPHQALVATGESAGEARVEALRALGVLRGVDDDGLELLARASRVSTVREGEAVTTRWGGGRDFYVLLEGGVEVVVDGEVVRTLASGGFFGELAALDWGAGYGYTRLATVSATSPSRLLVVPPDVFNRLVAEVPALEERIREAARERLARS
jgi:aromatic-L-amino-acid/L-tryptophan decarboxylase